MRKGLDGKGGVCGIGKGKDKALLSPAGNGEEPIGQGRRIELGTAFAETHGDDVGGGALGEAEGLGGQTELGPDIALRLGEGGRVAHAELGGTVAQERVEAERKEGAGVEGLSIIPAVEPWGVGRAHAQTDKRIGGITVGPGRKGKDAEAALGVT